MATAQDETPRHGGNAGLCEEPHFCDNCLNALPCVDLFIHPECGLVACATGETPVDDG